MRKPSSYITPTPTAAVNPAIRHGRSLLPFAIAHCVLLRMWRTSSAAGCIYEVHEKRREIARGRGCARRLSMGYIYNIYSSGFYLTNTMIQTKRRLPSAIRKGVAFDVLHHAKRRTSSPRLLLLYYRLLVSAHTVCAYLNILFILYRFI